MPEFNELKKLLKKDHTGLPTIKMALVGDTATQLLSTALRGMGAKRGYNIQLFEGGYNQVEQLFLNSESELHHFGAEVIILFQSTHKLAKKLRQAMRSDDGGR